ncbi:MAG: hypothetical protein WBH82_07700 [Arcanobacterium sp.]
MRDYCSAGNDTSYRGGRDVTDPHVLDLCDQVARNEIFIEDAVAIVEAKYSR